MFLIDHILELADRLGVQDIGKPDVRALLTRKINEAYKEVARVFDWEHLRNAGELPTVPNYQDGTAAVVNGSRGVTGSGTAWTAAMVGRYFQPPTGQNWYRIMAVTSTTSLTLQTAIVDTSGSGNYTIWKRFYYLPSRVRKVHLLGKWTTDGALEGRSQDYFSQLSPNIAATGEPTDYAPYGVDDFESSYVEGSVTLANDSNVAQGNGTSWLNNAEEGDRLIISGVTLRVKRVESDTRIVLLNSSTIDVENSAYTISKDSRIGFQFYPSPAKAYVLPYSYYKRVFDMVNENKDRSELPEDFDMAIADGAEASRMRDLDDAKWLQKQLEFTARIKDLRAKYMVHTPKLQQAKPFIRSRR